MENRFLLTFSAIAGAAGRKFVSDEEKIRLVFRTPYDSILGPCLGFHFWASLAFSVQDLNF